ncbi:MAG: DUF177 domain-containing protein [Thermotogae bacterium]|nr:DUF177 domain-containing protein [Thermotogaceae bacterium]RKX36308.1 MAG: DUF177 domain-containing protein [Thermotogota bacterium]
MEFVIDLDELGKRGKLTLQGIYPLDSVDFVTGPCPVLEPAFVKIVVVKTDLGIAVGGYVKTIIEHPCDRCLEPVAVPINGTIEALYKNSEQNERQEETQDLRNVIYYSGNRIDLSERILEAIIVDIPSRVLCKPDCRGLCPYCGENLNEHPDHECESNDSSADPRMNKLKDLRQIIKEG